MLQYTTGSCIFVYMVTKPQFYPLTSICYRWHGEKNVQRYASIILYNDDLVIFVTISGKF
jgi:hypothetical protein